MKNKKISWTFIIGLILGVIFLAAISIAEDISGGGATTGTVTGTSTEMPAIVNGVELPKDWTVNKDRDLLFKGNKALRVPEGIQIKSISQDGNIELTGKSSERIVVNGAGAKNIKSLKIANGDVTWYGKDKVTSVENRIGGARNIELEFKEGQPTRIKFDKDSGGAIFNDLNGRPLSTSFSQGGSIEVTGSGIKAKNTDAVQFEATSRGKEITYKLDSLAPSGTISLNNDWGGNIARDADGNPTNIQMSSGGVTREGLPRVSVPNGGSFEVRNGLPKSQSESSFIKSGLWFEEGKGIQIKGIQSSVSGQMNGGNINLKVAGQDSIGQFNIERNAAIISGEGEIVKTSPNPTNPNEPLQFKLKSNPGSGIMFNPKNNFITSEGAFSVQPSEKINIQFDQNGNPTIKGSIGGNPSSDLNKLFTEGKSQEFDILNYGKDGSKNSMRYSDLFASNQNNKVELVDSKKPTFQFTKEPSQNPSQNPQTAQKSQQLPERKPDTPILPADKPKQTTQNPLPNMPEGKNYDQAEYTEPKYQQQNPDDIPKWPTDSNRKVNLVNLGDGTSNERIAGLSGGDLPEGDLQVEDGRSAGGGGHGISTNGAGTSSNKPGQGRLDTKYLTQKDMFRSRVDIGETGKVGDDYEVQGYVKDPNSNGLNYVAKNTRTGEQLMIAGKELAEEWGNKAYRTPGYEPFKGPNKILLSDKQLSWATTEYRKVNSITDTSNIRAVSFNEPPPIITDASAQQIENAKDIYLKPSVSSDGAVSLKQDDGSAKNAVKYKVTEDGKLIDPANEKIVGSVVNGKAQLNMPVSMKVTGTGEFAGKRIVAFQEKSYVVDGGETGAKEAADYEVKVADALMKGKNAPEPPSNWKEYTPKSSVKELNVAAIGNKVIVSSKGFDGENGYVGEKVFKTPEDAKNAQQALQRGVNLKSIQTEYPDLRDSTKRTELATAVAKGEVQNNKNLQSLQRFFDNNDESFLPPATLEKEAQKQLGVSLAQAKTEYNRLLEQKTQSYEYLGRDSKLNAVYGSLDGENWERIADGKKVDANSIPFKEETFSTPENVQPTKTQVALEKVKAEKLKALDLFKIVTPPASLTIPASTVKTSTGTDAATVKADIVRAPNGYSGDWPPKLKSAMDKPASMSDAQYRNYINNNPVPGMEDKWTTLGYGEKRFQEGKYFMSERAKFDSTLKQFSTSDLQIPYQNIPTTPVGSRGDLGNNIYYTRFVDKGTKLADGSKSTTAVRYFYDSSANLIGFYKFPNNKDKKAGYYKL